MRFFVWAFFLFIFFHLLILFNLPDFIISGHAPYSSILYKYFSFGPFTPLANFDGIQYLDIAKDGYKQFQQGYFPLFPLFISILTHSILPNKYLLSGLIINFLTFFAGIIYFYKFVNLLLKDRKKAKWSIVFLLFFPTAFFYQAIYPESLFLFTSSAGLFYLMKKKYFLAAIFATFASLTKIQGIFLIIPFVFSIYEINFGKNIFFDFFKKLMNMPKLIFAALSPIYGLIIYSTYLFINYGDPFYFYHAQSAFGANRSTDAIIFLPQVIFRYIKIFLTADFSFQYTIALLEFIIFIFVFGVLAFEIFRILKNKKKQSLILFSIHLYSIAVMILPTLTGTFTSIPRYSLLALGFFIALSGIQNKYFKIFLVSLFGYIHILLFVLFLREYFIG